MTKLGTLYCLGIGPGDPELVTVKAARLLGESRHVIVPKARMHDESTAWKIAGRYVSADALVHEIIFPMVADRAELSNRWLKLVEPIAELLETGEDACFLTLGDAMLYSTCIHLLAALKVRLPEARVEVVAGVPAMCAVAAATRFALGVAKQPVTIVPLEDDLSPLERALETGGTVVMMKIAHRLQRVLDVLERRGLLGRSVFVMRVGLEGECIETDLGRLREAGEDAGNFSIILVHGAGEDLP